MIGIAIHHHVAVHRRKIGLHHRIVHIIAVVIMSMNVHEVIENHPAIATINMNVTHGSKSPSRSCFSFYSFLFLEDIIAMTVDVIIGAMRIRRVAIAHHVAHPRRISLRLRKLSRPRTPRLSRQNRLNHRRRILKALPVNQYRTRLPPLSRHLPVVDRVVMNPIVRPLVIAITRNPRSDRAGTVVMIEAIIIDVPRTNRAVVKSHPIKQKPPRM